MSKKTAPYGTWKSPITAEIIMGASTSFDDVLVDPVTLVNYHIEGRPVGRSALVNTVSEQDVVAGDWDVRTGVHDYGGGAAIVYAGTVYFSNKPDGRVYSVKEGGTPLAITPEDPQKLHRFANFAVSPKQPTLLVSVFEDHTDDPNDDKPENVINSLCVIDAAAKTQVPLAGITPADFYAAPCFNADGTKLAWLQWYHPDMPWEGSELWVADVAYAADRPGLRVTNARTVSGEKLNVSVGYPTWADATTLVFTNDSSGFINPWKYSTATGRAEPVLAAPLEEDFAPPAWNLGGAPFALAPGTTGGLFTAFRGGANILYYIDVGAPATALEIKSGFEEGFASVGAVRAGAPGQLEFVFEALRSNLKRPSGIIRCVLSGGAGSVAPTPTYTVLKAVDQSFADEFPPGIVSAPVSKAWTIPGPAVPLYAILYKPANPAYEGPTDPTEKPPCIINVHGGPTSLAVPTLDWQKQYYTSRGWAWLDVNYGGSSGYGRAYVQLLATQWGIKDVADCLQAAKFLPDDIDVKRVLIRGGSSGGYTALSAISFGPEQGTFYAAAASYYGISNLRTLAQFTHKFELRYMIKLLGGTYEEIPKVYDEERSPIFNAGRITTPLLILQGTLDQVVPPPQSQAIYDKVIAAGKKAKLIMFEGEGHGFRKAENKIKALEAERGWYEEVLKLKP